MHLVKTFNFLDYNMCWELMSYQKNLMHAFTAYFIAVRPKMYTESLDFRSVSGFFVSSEGLSCFRKSWTHTGTQWALRRPDD